MIAFSGFEDVEIVFTGLSPWGGKLHELLVSDGRRRPGDEVEAQIGRRLGIDHVVHDAGQRGRRHPRRGARAGDLLATREALHPAAARAQPGLHRFTSRGAAPKRRPNSPGVSKRR